MKTIKFARCCDECGAGMNEGFCIESGESYYCSEECLHKNYSEEEWQDMYADGEGNSYYTEWECDDDMWYEMTDGKLTAIE
jgi:hypothetical protein